jgi:hypothetical protein
MGDNVLESQAQNTRKRRQRHRESQSQGQLFVRPEVVAVEYTVECTDGNSIASGDRVNCYVAPDGVQVDVVKETRRVGIVSRSGGAELLRRSLDTSGIASAVVRKACELSGTATIAIVTG